MLAAAFIAVGCRFLFPLSPWEKVARSAGLRIVILVDVDTSPDPHPSASRNGRWVRDR